MSCSGLNAINPVCLASDEISAQASDAASAAFVHVAGYFGTAATKATEWLWQEIDSATTLDLQSPALLKEMGATAAVAAVLCLGLFAIQVIGGALRSDPSALRRAVVGLGVSFVGSALALGATRVLLGAVDALSASFVQYTMGTNVSGLGSKLAAADLASVSNPAVVVLLALVILAAVVIVWAAMMIRKLMIIVAAVLSPFAFAGAAADISRAWVRRWIEFVCAMIASKLLLVIILSVGIAILDGAGASSDGATASITQVTAGTLVLLMGGLAPWIAIKLFTFVGESLHVAHLQAAQATTGARAVISAPQKVGAIRASAHSILPLGGHRAGPPLMTRPANPASVPDSSPRPPLARGPSTHQGNTGSAPSVSPGSAVHSALEASAPAGAGPPAAPPPAPSTSAGPERQLANQPPPPAPPNNH